MAIQIQGFIGPAVLSDGLNGAPRLGKTGETVMQELHGRFYEQAYRGNLYCGAAGNTGQIGINNVTYTIATLGATCTPIIGLWNPATSSVNAVILQATLGVILSALLNTGTGPFVWHFSIGNAAISTGSNPVNRKTFLAPGGSLCKDMSNVALTGLTNNLVGRCASGLGGGSVYNISNTDTAAGFTTLYAPSVENLDGSIVVPPGGVLALLATTTAVAHSVCSSILWEEVPT